MRGLGARIPFRCCCSSRWSSGARPSTSPRSRCDHTTPAFTAFSRGAFGFLVLLPFLSAFGSRLPRTLRAVGIRRRDGLRRHDALARGLAEGTARAGPAIAAVLLNTAPVLRRRDRAGWPSHERVTALRALGLVVGFTGVVTIILAGNSSSGEDVVIGAALTLLGAIGYGSAGLLDALPLADRRAARHHGPHGRAVPLRRHLPASRTCSLSATSAPATGAPPSCGGRSRSS